MPIYEYHNTETDEVWEEFWSISSHLEFLENNPLIKQVPCAPNFVSGIAGVTHKNDSGFNDMLSRIAAANPYSPLAEKHGDKGIKASKTREAVKKAKAAP